LSEQNSQPVTVGAQISDYQVSATIDCGYCQAPNPEDGHRCHRCGRRLLGSARPAPAHLAKEHVRIAMEALGANALAPSAAADNRAQRKTPAKPRRAIETPMDAARTLDSLPPRRATSPAQPTLFGAEFQPKIIPFETLPRTSAGGSSSAAPAPAMERRVDKTSPEKPPRAKPSARRTPAPDDSQATLDFLPPLKSTPRTLKTNADAVIYCDAEVAAPIHRATAAALDLAIILIGFGCVLAIFQAVAHPAGLDRKSLLLLGSMLAVCALFYGLLFAIAGTVTPGLRWTHLRLINFDGFPPDGRSRALRLAGCWIGALSGGLGIFWALLDEENLTWHDHMSKTFPTLRESESIVVRQRRR
jgi:uncharacterized RDD family membrane protein YckC/ribosomal protein L40E